MTTPPLPSLDVDRLLAGLAPPHDEFAARYPGESAGRQPIHTVYGGAHLFRAGTAGRLGAAALRFLDEYAPDPAGLAEAVGLDPDLAPVVYGRVREKLETEAVEDFRIDFEDGFGPRPDDEEDKTAVSAAREVGRGAADGTLPPFIGIRIRPLNRELAARALRTLDLFVSSLVAETGGAVPKNFVVTLPKVVDPAQVSTLVEAFQGLEGALDLMPGTLRVEIMVETPQSIFGADGSTPLPEIVAAGGGRCIAAHFGVYDFTASCSITADYQVMRHPICDLARQVMLVSLAGTGTQLSDGATNILPVPIHRDGDAPLTAEQHAENRDTVFRAWRLHYEDVRHSLVNGFYQGWDLHPAQLVTRYAAVYAFFLESLGSASSRLRHFVDQAALASLHGDVFDDAATGQGLLNFFLRGLGCGAISEEEALATGLTLDELRSRSFAGILQGRAGPG